MLETRATVVKLDGGNALVESDHVSSCEQCNGKGCASSKLGQLFCSRPRQFQVENSIGAKVGDDVLTRSQPDERRRDAGVVGERCLDLMSR